MTRNKKFHYFLGSCICFLGAMYYAYEYLLRISPSVMEEALMQHFNLSAATFGLLSAFYYYAYVPLQLPVGILLDRFGPRLLLTSACSLCVIGTYLFADTTFFSVSALGRFLVGFGSAFAYIGVLKLATIWLPEDKLALVAGLTSALGTIGAMVGDNVLGYFVEQVGWVKTMHYTATFGILLALALWLGIRDKRHDHSQHLLTGHGTISNLKRSFIDLWIIIRTKQMWINGLFGCLVYLPTTVFGELWGIPYLMHAHHLSKEAAEVANSFLFFGFMVGAPITGFISDKIKRRKPPMLYGALGAFIIMSIIVYGPIWPVNILSVLMFCLGLCYSSQCIVFAVGRESSPPEAAATAIAMTNMVVMLGAMLMQPFVGFLLDWHATLHQGVWIHHPTMEAVRTVYTAADYQFAISVIPIGIFIAAILVLWIKETYADLKS